MQEFIHGRRTSANVLQVVDQQYIGAAQFFFEGQGFLTAQSREEATHKIFGTQRKRAATLFVTYFQSDGIEEVRLAIAESAMKEQKIGRAHV